MWEFREPRVLEYEEPREFLPASDEQTDVSGFNPPTWVITFQVRRSFRVFGRRLWTGDWQPMQMVAR